MLDAKRRDASAHQSQRSGNHPAGPVAGAVFPDHRSEQCSQNDAEDHGDKPGDGRPGHGMGTPQCQPEPGRGAKDDREQIPAECYEVFQREDVDTEAGLRDHNGKGDEETHHEATDGRERRDHRMCETDPASIALGLRVTLGFFLHYPCGPELGNACPPGPSRCLLTALPQADGR